jgi:hypothetical protein
MDFTHEKNDGIRLVAEHIFNKSKNDSEVYGFLSEDMDILDIFCMFIELVLYGINILQYKSLFEITDEYDPIINDLNDYLKKTGIRLVITEQLTFGEDIELFNERQDYMFQILPKPSDYLMKNAWTVLNYRIIENKNSDNEISAIFYSHERKVYKLHFVIKR